MSIDATFGCVAAMANVNAMCHAVGGGQEAREWKVNEGGLLCQKPRFLQRFEQC